MKPDAATAKTVDRALVRPEFLRDHHARHRLPSLLEPGGGAIDEIPFVPEPAPGKPVK